MAPFFNSAFRLIEQHHLLVHNILCNPDDLKQFRIKCNSSYDGHPLIESSHLWTADYVPCAEVRPGFVITLGYPDRLGVVSERAAPCVLYSEKNDKLIAFMDNGYGVINQYAGIVHYVL